MKVLITLGPTQEPIDDVRFITNASSGRMGVALAEEGILRGHDITIVAGPVNVPIPPKAAVHKVRTAEEMTSRTLELLGGQDALVSAAAIADYTPIGKADGKIKSGKDFTLKLKRTRKLIGEARNRFPKLFIVGFKAECGLSQEGLTDSARRRMRENKLDLIVANDLKDDILGSDETKALIIDEYCIERVGRSPKSVLARRIWDKVEGRKKA